MRRSVVQRRAVEGIPFAQRCVRGEGSVEVRRRPIAVVTRFGRKALVVAEPVAKPICVFDGSDLRGAPIPSRYRPINSE